MGVEQSNSSIVFGDALVLKVFRRVEPGVNPELEMLRFLSARGFAHIAAARAAGTSTRAGSIDATLGVAAGASCPTARDGWELALDELAHRPGRVPRAPRARSARSPARCTRRSARTPTDPAFAPEEPSDGGARRC